LLLATILSMVGCKRTSEFADNVVRFNAVEIDEMYALVGDSGRPSCHVQIHYEYPDSADTHLLPILQNLFIETMFGETFRDTPPAQILQEYTRLYVDDFKQFETTTGRQRRSPDGEVEHATVEPEGYSRYIQLKIREGIIRVLISYDEIRLYVSKESRPLAPFFK
jgi:hypothetical protein